MPQIKKHKEFSLARTGKCFGELHEWMESPDIMKRLKRHGSRHFAETLGEAERLFGEEAREECKRHISDDKEHNILFRFLRKFF